jgi:hypothetical protein
MEECLRSLIPEAPSSNIKRPANLLIISQSQSPQISFSYGYYISARATRILSQQLYITTPNVLY